MGVQGIKKLVELLNNLVLGLGGVVDDYVKCLEGEVPKLVGLDRKVVKCKRKYDFTLARLELLDSVLPEVKVRKEYCGQPRTLIVDEFQDMSPLMLGILGKWLSSADVEHFVVAGDFDQLIYRSLHHADLEIPRWLYQQAKVRDGWQVIELSYSHRVAKPLDALSIEFLNAYDNEPSPWRKWEGNKDKFGVLYVESVEDALWGIARDFEMREDLRWGKVSYAVLTPTNEVVLSLATELMKMGILPHFLKGYPTRVAKVVEHAKTLLSSDPVTPSLASLDVRDKDIIGAISGVIRYAWLKAKDYSKEAITHHLEGKESSSIEDALRVVIERELDVKYLTYAKNPRAPVFIDTVYTAKGLEFDKVFIANYARKNSKVPRDKWGARLFYVALTRSKGSVVVVTSNDKNDVEWFPTDKIKEVAKKVGVEVVEK
jgi:superfamily I DNA/RNA helicase